jgi:ABC-2 type transport system permease protein
MDKLILKFVLFIAKTFLKKDVDFEKLKIITETKLILDRRRVRVAMKNNTAKKEPGNQILVTLIVYGIMGLLIALIIPTVKDIVISMTIIHCYVLFMMAMTLITDFSSVLLDTTDNQIILPRPVNSKTFFVARLVHILVYLLQFTIAVALFPIIFTFITHGLFVGLACIFTILLTVLFSVFLTYLLYGIILKFSTEQRLKDIISGFQIVMTIVFAVGFQIIPRLFNVDKLMHFTMPIHWYTYFLPPLWMANLLQSVKTFSVDLPHLGMIILAITVPLITFWVMITFLAPSFSKKIAALGNAGDETTSEEKNAAANKIPLSEKLSPILCSNKTERAGFELAWKMTGRDKSFKIQFYPSLAYIAVFAFIFIFSSSKNYVATWQNLPNSNSFLWFVYLPMFTISTAIGLIAFNENFAASWVYFSRPLQKPGSLISGALKSLLVKFMLPIVIILFAFAYYVWGYKIIDDFVLGIFNNILIFMLLSHMSKSYLPFSMQPNLKQQTGKFIQVIVQMLVIAVLVGLHYLAIKIWWLVAALIPVSAVSCYFLLRMVQNYSWQKIAT